MKAMRLFFIITIIASPLFAQNYATFIAKGDEYYDKFDNMMALTEYQKAYELFPDSYETLMKLTRAYIDVGEDLNSKESENYFIKGVQYAETLVKKYPDKAEAYFYLSAAYGNLALFRGGREKVKLSRQVEGNIKKSIKLDPNDDRFYAVLGVYYREVANLNWFLKKFAQAFLGGLPDGTNEDSEEMLLKAISLNPRNVYAHYELSKTYEAMNKLDEVVKYLQKVIELPMWDHQDKQVKAEAKTMLEKYMKKRG